VPVMGRWVVMEPLAEKYPGVSPYVYTLNNPIRYFDPNGLYTVESQILFGTVYATARRVTFAEAQATELAGFVPVIGALVPFGVKHSLNDPSFSVDASDYGFLAAEFVMGRTGRMVGAFADEGLELLAVEGALGAGNAGLDLGSAHMAGQSAALGLDEITFEVANSINVEGSKLGSLGGFGGNTFTLGRELTRGKSKDVAERLLRTKLGQISNKLSSIASKQKFDLSKRQGRKALRKYIQENQTELEEELGIEFIE